MRIPTLHDEGTDDESPAFPSATIPPVNVTFGEAITFAGSDKPEIMMAWMLEATVGATGGEAGDVGFCVVTPLLPPGGVSPPEATDRPPGK